MKKLKIKNGKTILVVEDEPALIAVIKDKLENSGFFVETEKSAEGALYSLEKKRPDLIWLDHYLFGKGDGLAFAERIKAGDSAFKDIPIFVIANILTKDKMRKYLDLGINKYYIKSDYRLSQIIEEIQDFLSLRE